MATPPKYELPDNLPIPEDDGACDHLTGAKMPPIDLDSTDGVVNLAKLQGLTVVYIYPRSSPDSDDPDGWDEIPGARGCSPQGCAFRDHQAELLKLGARVFGLSTQPSDYLKSEAERLHLPFELVSDLDLKLNKELNIPLLNMENHSESLYKRVTLIIKDGIIIKFFYPVFPPDKNAEQVISWLAKNSHS